MTEPASFDLVLRSTTLTDRMLAVEFVVVANRVPARRSGSRVDLDLSWIEAAEGDDIWLQWPVNRRAWQHVSQLIEFIDMAAVLTKSKANFEWAAGVLARHRGRLVQLSWPDGKSWTWSEATDPRSLTGRPSGASARRRAPPTRRASGCSVWSGSMSGPVSLRIHPRCKRPFTLYPVSRYPHRNIDRLRSGTAKALGKCHDHC